MADQPPAAPAAPAVPSRPTTATAPTQQSPSIPVVLREAGLDSPSFRATAVHFMDQVDAIERWLDGLVRTSNRLSHDMLRLDESINQFLYKLIPPSNVISVDHDYTALALKRHAEGSREYWNSVLNTARQLETLCVEPIRAFLSADLRPFKDTRRTLDQSQKTFDTTLSRYLSLSKTKEPSSIREDAFAVYETRKAYLRASMDFCISAPTIRFALDKLLIRVSSDMWREMKKTSEATASFGKWAHEMDRVRGWSKEMELNEPVFKRELHWARREVGEGTLALFKPSREIDDYSTHTVPFLGSKGPMNVATEGQAALVSEKQGWLYLRTIGGKPARHIWIRRWFYCRDGIFSWLVNGPQGVLQGDEIGVLLCNARPAVSEERRFCLELKTRNQTLLLQAETQHQLMEWLEVFEVAKKKAFEASLEKDKNSRSGGIDPAFSITAPSLPEFSAKLLDNQMGLGSDDPALERQGTLGVPEGPLASRQSFDVSAQAPKRTGTSTLVREEGESGREHAARIMQKLDLHRKNTFNPATIEPTPAAQPPAPTSGIAGLISASHGLLPGYQPALLQNLATPKPPASPGLGGPEPQPGSLAPTTLAKPPAHTNLSKTAVVYSSDRAFTANPSHTVPPAILANYWGSSVWAQDVSQVSRPDTDDIYGIGTPDIKVTPVGDTSDTKVPTKSHKKAVSIDSTVGTITSVREKEPSETFPRDYPVELKANSAQFRLLFPTVPLDEKLVLVFRASWTSTSEGNPNAPQMTGNGRIYLTPDNMYFYGHHLGLVVAYAFSLDRITEATAAPGRNCDFMFLHLAQDTEGGYSRITIKTYLESLDLLHARVNLLIDDIQAEEPMDLRELVSALIGLEQQTTHRRSVSMDSWEEVSSNEHMDEGHTSGNRASGPRTDEFVYKSRTRQSAAQPKLQLPTRPVFYEPPDMQRKVAERHFELSAKACFHVLFGDKSFVFPKIYFERESQKITQGPWTSNAAGKMERSFSFNVDTTRLIGPSREATVTDTQTIDMFSDHVTYVVTHVRTPWHLPHTHSFKLVTKIVITHVGKSKCKLALFAKVAWSKAPTIGKRMIERQALNDAEADCDDLAEVATEQVRRLGPHSRTKRAIQVYGNIGEQTQAVVFTRNENAEPAKGTQVKPKSLLAMIIETGRSFMESAITSVMMWAFAGIKKLWNVVTAQRLLIALLGLSVVTNMLVSSQNTVVWWGERRAAKFMNRIGVGPNVMMSKAIYLADLDEAARSSAIQTAWPQDSQCFSTFQSIANNTDLSSPWQEAGSSLSSTSSRATARRLRRTRQRLGSYRHDLLVAMRTLNHVEREMIQSEWENWLLDENYRCEQVEDMLREKDRSASERERQGSDEGSQKVLNGREDSRREALRSWHGEYCGSCKHDREALMVERQGLSMGGDGR